MNVQELRDDARFYNKYVDFLRQRFSAKNYYDRLGVPLDATTSQLKKAYHVRLCGGWLVACSY